MLNHRMQILALFLCISGNTNSLGALLETEVLKLKTQTINLDVFANTGTGNQKFQSLLYAPVFDTKIDQTGFNVITSDHQIILLDTRKPLLSGMSEGDPPKKPNLTRKCGNQFEPMSFEDLLNLVLWLLEQINSGYIQTQDCVIELLSLLSTQLSLGQIGDSYFRELLSLFINLIHQNDSLFELVRKWLDA